MITTKTKACAAQSATSPLTKGDVKYRLSIDMGSLKSE
jgi:hypothetical protein